METRNLLPPKQAIKSGRLLQSFCVELDKRNSMTYPVLIVGQNFTIRLWRKEYYAETPERTSTDRACWVSFLNLLPLDHTLVFQSQSYICMHPFLMNPNIKTVFPRSWVFISEDPYVM